MKQNYEIFIFSWRKHEFIYTLENRRVRSFQRPEEMVSREQNDAWWEEETGGKSSRRCVAGMAGPYGVSFKWHLFLRSGGEVISWEWRKECSHGMNFEKRTLKQSQEEQSKAFPGTQGKITGSIRASQRWAPLPEVGRFSPAVLNSTGVDLGKEEWWFIDWFIYFLLLIAVWHTHRSMHRSCIAWWIHTVEAPVYPAS